MNIAEPVLFEGGCDYQMLYFTSSSLSSDDSIFYGKISEKAPSSIGWK